MKSTGENQRERLPESYREKPPDAPRRSYVTPRFQAFPLSSVVRGGGGTQFDGQAGFNGLG